MSRSLNKVMLIGNVGNDPKLKYTSAGIPVTTFFLATSEILKDKEGAHYEHTDWHTIVAWRGLAEIINKMVRKGSRIYIEGRINTKTFEDRFGNPRHNYEIFADSMLLLDPRHPNDIPNGEVLKNSSNVLDDLDFNLNFETKIDDDFSHIDKGHS
jgi:single-strand DNA-binding protein